MTALPPVEVGRRHKYGAVPTEVDGLRFASKAEAKRYSELKLYERAKEIWGLKVQEPFPLYVNGIKVGTYVADFVYSDAMGEHVEDVKGVSTPVFRLKRKVFEAQYGREIEIIGGRK